ncbi:MAG: hypothetical protein M3Z66_10570 [Chloroflexota bacterium]|nr:hypothetical protein [Chloroflexota bacterium]
MNTYEARTYMRDIAREGLEIVDRLAAGTPPAFDERRRLHQLASEARGALSDAGYPGEGVWRAIQRASIAIDTGGDQSDGAYWRDLADDLRSAVETLDSLVSPGLGREIDFPVVG